MTTDNTTPEVGNTPQPQEGGQAERAPRPSGPRPGGYNRGGDRRGAPAGGPGGMGGGRKRFFRKKVCYFCTNKVNTCDYKDTDLLRKFVTERGKLLPRRITGTCAKHQRMVAREIRKARIVALLPFEDK